jgi:hypothetical protein
MFFALRTLMPGEERRLPAIRGQLGDGLAERRLCDIFRGVSIAIEARDRERNCA